MVNTHPWQAPIKAHIEPVKSLSLEIYTWDILPVIFLFRELLLIGCMMYRSCMCTLGDNMSSDWFAWCTGHACAHLVIIWAQLIWYDKCKNTVKINWLAQTIIIQFWYQDVYCDITMKASQLFLCTIYVTFWGTFSHSCAHTEDSDWL